MKRLFIMPKGRVNAVIAVSDAPDGYVVTIKEPTRNLEQSAKFHAICHDLAKMQAPWAGKARTQDQWKVLLVSGHAVATKEGAEMVPGLESEYVNLRESTALMSKRRASSLIEYAQAYLESVLLLKGDAA